MNGMKNMTITIEKTRTLTVEPIKPDTCTSHYQFEIFARQTLFPQTRYEILLKKPDSPIKEPHLKLKSRFSELMFYVEAKYTLHRSDPMIEWCEPSEFKRFQELDNQMPVYILIGEGPHPAESRMVYFCSR